MNKKEILICLGLTCLTFFLFFFQLGTAGLFEPDEGRYSEIPREMIENGDYIVPRLNGVLYFEKPPLVYWSTVLCFQAFGFNEFAGRFTGAFLGALGVLLTFFLSRKMYGLRSAVFSSLILLASLEYFFVGRIILLDMPLSFFILSSFFTFYFYLYSEKKKTLWLFLFYISLGLGILTKGPVALVLPGGLCFLYLLMTGQLIRFLKDKMHFPGFILFLLVTLPWFVLVIKREPSFFQFFFIREHVQRFLTNEHNRDQSFFYFFLILLVGFFPWICYVPFAMKRYLRLWPLGRKRSSDTNPFLFLCLWAFGILGFFTISTSKLVAYIVPIFPALSIMVGRYMDEVVSQGEKKSKESLFLFGFLLLHVLVFALFAIYYALMRQKIEGVTPIIVMLGLTLITGFVISAFLFFRQNKRRASFFVQITSLFLVEMLVITGIVRAESYLSARPLAAVLKEVKNPGEKVYSIGCYEQAVPFYIQERIRIIDWVGELEFGVESLSEEERAKWFLKGRYDVMSAELKGEERVFFVINEDDYEDFQKKHPDIISYVLAVSHEKCLVSNRKDQ